MNEQEIEFLEAMLTRIEECESVNKILMNSNKALINGNKVLSEALDSLRKEYEHYTENSIYEILDPRRRDIKGFYPKIKTPEETLDVLLKNKHSLCRFGDGEFACINGKLRAQFTTEYYPLLAKRLKEVLNSNDEKIMIAIADNYGDLSGYAPSCRREIRSYMTPEKRKEHEDLIDQRKEYFNAYITRPYTYLYDDTDATNEYWKKIRSLWNNRKVVIIEGYNTGMGVGNDLLDNSSGINRIIAPSIDAFARYDEILKSALNQSEDRLYLIALGPVATVLAYDLAKTGRQAIDIGHLDVEYEWMKRGEYRCIIPHKYVNEVVGGTTPEPIEDEKYLSQIITRI